MTLTLPRLIGILLSFVFASSIFGCAGRVQDHMREIDIRNIFDEVKAEPTVNIYRLYEVPPRRLTFENQKDGIFYGQYLRSDRQDAAASQRVAAVTDNEFLYVTYADASVFEGEPTTNWVNGDTHPDWSCIDVYRIEGRALSLYKNYQRLSDGVINDSSTYFNTKGGRTALPVRTYIATVDNLVTGEEAPVSASAPAAPPAKSLPEKLKGLQSMLKNGLITQEEHNKKKAALLENY